MTVCTSPLRAHAHADLVEQLPRLTSPLLRDLAAEWVSIHDHSTVSEWSHDHVALRGLDTPGDLVDAIDDGDSSTKDAILGALLDLAQGGEHTAGRVLLQAMLPALVNHATKRRLSNELVNVDERLQVTIAVFWEVMASTTARKHVAARLSLDTLHKITAHQRRRSDVWEHHTVVVDQTESWEEPPCTEASAPIDGLSDAMDLAMLLTWALDGEVITVDEAQLLARAYLTDESRVRHELAAEQAGISLRICRKRRERALSKIKTAVRDELNLHPCAESV